MTTTCSYAELERQLQSAGADNGAAEAHGLLSGVVAAGGRAAPSVWLEHLLGEGNTLSAAAGECSELLAGLQDEILCQLHDDAFGYALLLPPDSSTLPTRTRALGEWCRGFLFGLVLGGVREDRSLPASVSEVMRDFFEISHAGFSTDAPDESDEAAYLEITEYVRMSVVLLHEELQPAPEPARLQ